MSDHRAPTPEDEGTGDAARRDVAQASRPQRRGQAAYEMFVLYALIAVGTMIGGVLRALVSVWTFGALGPGFPWATLSANVAGSLLIGFYATLTACAGRWPAGPRQRQFVMSGICGGFTTFSIFSLESMRLAQMAQWHAAGLNVAVSMLACLVAVWLGHVLAARLGRPTTEVTR